MPRGRWYFQLRATTPHAVGEQRRGQRVAGVPLVAPAVEREREPRAAIDAAAGRQAAAWVTGPPRLRLAHRRSAPHGAHGGASPGLYTAVIR